jgi:hypothetical protein
MKFFEKRRKKNQELNEAFTKVYDEISSIENWDDPKKLEHYILDSCEQIIGLTKEIEAEKAEYRILTAYLADMEAIENLPKKDLGELKEVASNIEELKAAKESFASRTPNISDTQFLLIEQEEENLPDTISRMQDNERYLESVSRDKNVLEGQKNQWEIERDDLKKKARWIRNISFVVILLYAMILLLLIVMGQISNFDLTISYLVMFLICGVGGFSLYLYSNRLSKGRRQATKNMNQAIALLNVVSMKYANVTKAIAYTKEKYHVNSSTELNYIWEQYMEAVRQKERLMKNNDDLEYFNGRLIRLLQKLDLYDRKIWLNQTRALLEDEEMTAVRKDLVLRRQKIRERIEENRKVVRSERNEIDRLMEEHDQYVPEITEIIQSVDKLCGLQPQPQEGAEDASEAADEAELAEADAMIESEEE